MARLAPHVALAVLVAFLIFSASSQAQVSSTGFPPFATIDRNLIDNINLGNLNDHIEIPLRSSMARGLPMQTSLFGDTAMTVVTPNSFAYNWAPASEFGQFAASDGYSFMWDTSNVLCPDNVTYTSVSSNFRFMDGHGTTHYFGVAYDSMHCYPSYLASGATDGGNLILDLTSGQAIVRDTNGIQYYPSYTDPNGNTAHGIGASPSVVDASGNTILNKVTSPFEYTYTGPAGVTETFLPTYSSFTFRTNFGCSSYDSTGTSGAYPLITQLNLPDGSNYQFTYEQTPGVSQPDPHGYNYVTGRIKSIKLPSGATITYNYNGTHNGVSCEDGGVSGFTKTTPDGTWTYSRLYDTTNKVWNTTVFDPQGNKSVYTFSGGSQSSYVGGSVTSPVYETQKQVYQLISGTQTLILKTVTCYNMLFSTCGYPALGGGATIQKDVYTYVAPSLTSPSLSEVFYQGNNQDVQENYYDFGVNFGSAPTTNPIRAIKRTYTPFGGTFGYSRPACEQVTAGPSPSTCGTVTANTNSITLYSNYDTHGNVGTVQNWVSGSTYLSKNFTYYSTGLPNVVTDVNGAQTSTTYGACNSSFPTQISEPLSLTKNMTWDCTGEVETSEIDANTQPTRYAYTDSLWRLGTITYPDNGQTTYTYNDTPTPPNIVTSQLMNSSGQSLTTQTNFDSLGRPMRKMLTSDPAGIVYTDTTYDSLGRVASVTNPYRSTSDPTYGVTQYAYDVLGRTTKVTNPDGSTQQIHYSGRAAQIQDEGNGTTLVTKISQSDGLGRLTSVCEVTSASQMGYGGTPANCGQDIALTGFLTSYTYDALGNLLSVAQPGVTNRSYQYDGLSRRTQVYDPEIGSNIFYNYDSCSAGDLCSRTAPKQNQTGSATVTTSYSYDSLHRLTGKSYNDGTTNNVIYLYDQLAPWGWNIANPKGHLTEEYTANSSGALTEQMFDYDPMGRFIETGSCTPLNCYGSAIAYHFNYTYDLLGNILTENNDRENITYTNTYNTAAQLTNFQSNEINSTHPGTLFTVNQYNPLGQIQQATFGNGVVRNATYNKLGKITAQTDGLLYSFTLGLAPDSNVLTGNDSVNGNWTYAYDDFNRLTTATRTSGSAFNYKYDRFGNRWQQNLTAGSGPAPQYTFDGGNRSPSFLYDAAGNIINDGSHNYTYDAEGHMLSVDGASTATYLYDANGQRVEEVVYGGAPTDFIYDEQGHMVTEATAASWIRSELYAGDNHVALYANSTTYFMHNDWLGSTKNQSDMSGNSAQWCNYLPFADGFGCPGSQLSLMSFTGDRWDGETGLSHTLFRQYNPTQGRWMTPDPSGMAAADPTNPQSWNRYAYVNNSPLNATDPLGLDDCPFTNASCDPSWWGSAIFSGDGTLGWKLGPDPMTILNQVLNGNYSAFGVPTLDQLDNPAIMNAVSDGPFNAQTTCAMNAAQGGSIASVLGVQNTFILGDLLGNSAADTLQLGGDLYGAAHGSFQSATNAFKSWFSGHEADKVKEHIIYDVGFRNKVIAKSINKGFGKRTNLLKVMAKEAGYAKMAGDALVLGAGYFYSCSALAN